MKYPLAVLMKNEYKYGALLLVIAFISPLLAFGPAMEEMYLFNSLLSPEFVRFILLFVLSLVIIPILFIKNKKFVELTCYLIAFSIAPLILFTTVFSVANSNVFRSGYCTTEFQVFGTGPMAELGYGGKTCNIATFSFEKITQRYDATEIGTFVFNNAVIFITAVTAVIAAIAFMRRHLKTI